jgi:hypothetical protein
MTGSKRLRLVGTWEVVDDGKESGRGRDLLVYRLSDRQEVVGNARVEMLAEPAMVQTMQ